MKYLFRLLLPALLLCGASAMAQPAPAPTGSPSTTTKISTGGGRATIVLPPEKAQPVRMPKFEKPPTIDGRLMMVGHQLWC
jgi:hypothetical protein